MSGHPSLRLVVLLLLTVSCYALAASQPPDCNNVTSCEVSGQDLVSLLRATPWDGNALAKYPPDSKNMLYHLEYSPDRKTYVLDPGLKYAQLLVVGANGKAIRLVVPGWEYRPLAARWLSDHVLELTMSFNPHAWVYWRWDVAQGRVISSRHCLEDAALEAKCEDQGLDSKHK